MSPTSSWPRILFPLCDSWVPLVASRPGALYTSPWSKKPKFDRWHQSLSHLLARWVFLPLSVLSPATDGMEENTTCAPDPFVGHLHDLCTWLSLGVSSGYSLADHSLLMSSACWKALRLLLGNLPFESSHSLIKFALQFCKQEDLFSPQDKYW